MNVDITQVLVSQSTQRLEKENLEKRLPSPHLYFLRPVRLAAILPTLRPGGACLLTVVGLPGD